MTLLDAGQKIDGHSVLGEDTWDLFEAIEGSFAVDLGDYCDLCGMTIEQIAKEIGKRAEYPANEKCLSASSFYRLRRAFAEVLSIPRASIRPATSVAELLPWRRRTKVRWDLIERRLELKLPGLVWPGWALLASVVAPAVLLIVLRVCFGIPLNALEIFIGSMLLIIPAAHGLVPFARVLPRGGETVGGLAKLVLARNYSAFASQHGARNGEEILWALRQIVATQTGRKIEEIFPTTQIPQDLKIY